MKLFKTIADCCLAFITFIAICVIIAFVYYHYFVKDTTIGVNNVNDQLAVDIKKDDELTEEERDAYAERWFMEANYYSNDKENGVQLQELKYNYFTGYGLTESEYRSTGMQFLGDFRTYTSEVQKESEANEKVLSEFYYYDTTNGINWSGFKGQYGSVATVLNRNQQFIIKIDNRPFSIQLDGKYDTYGRLWGFLWTVKQSTTYFDYGDVFDAVFSAIKSNDKGYGDYYITLDLSQYFSIKEYDSDSGKFKDDDVTDIIKNYAVLKFHYDENGARNSTQSIFGSIECNSKYDTADEQIDTTYWQERIVYNLTANDLDLRYSDFYEGSFASLPMATKEMFANMGRAKVNITLDLTNTNIIGFDFNAFENLEIDTIRITGTRRTFYLLEKCLYNTRLSRLEHSAEITLDFADNVIDSEYSEVII